MFATAKTLPLLSMVIYFCLTTSLHAQTVMDISQQGANFQIQSPNSAPRPLPTTRQEKISQTDPFLSAYQRQALHGDVHAQFTLGLSYLDDNDNHYDPGKALAWLHRAATSGDRLAQFHLGTLYQQSLGTPHVGTIQNDKEAMKWFLKVVEEDANRTFASLNADIIAWTQLKLAIIYYDGKGTPTNYQLARHWLQKVAENNHAYGQYLLGLIYAEGKGVPVDKQKAIYWLQTAASQGLDSAQEALKLHGDR